MKIPRPASLSSTLPAISEDGSYESRGASLPSPPTVPPRSARRLSNINSNVIWPPPRFNQEESPPSYWDDDNSIKNKDLEKFTQWRRGVVNNKHLAKRGGWLRLCVIAGIVLLCVLALVLGLVFGLRRKNKDSHQRNLSIVNGTTAFPVGSYSINTFLSSTTTSCTSNSNTWLCYPFSTYSQSQTESAATFDWIISVNPLEPTSYAISSTQNPFSITFANLTLSIRDQNTDNEHYFFATVMNKATRPTTQIGSKNVAATCNFNATTFQASLYTKRAKTYPSGNSTGAFENWPYAVEVRQVASNAPECVDPNGNSLGDFGVGQRGQECSCDYENTGT